MATRESWLDRLDAPRCQRPDDRHRFRPPADWAGDLHGKVSGAERDALRAVTAGEPVKAGGEPLRAGVLRAICLDRPQLVKDRVEVRDARVTGRLVLNGEHLRHGLRLHRCRFDDEVELVGADCDEPIEFDDCELGELTADRLNAAKDFRIIGCRLDGLRVRAADIDGDLVLTGSRFRRRQPAAIDGPDLLVEGSVLLNEGFRAHGAVTLRASRIGKDLDCRGGRFHHSPEPAGLGPECAEPALDASSVIVGGEVLCSYGFHAEGEVRVQWAQAHEVCFRGAILANPAGTALRADGLTTAAGLHLDQRMQATGTVRLVGACIGGEVAATKGIFDNPGGTAIEADRLAAKDLYLDRGFRASGRVSLDGADLGRQLNCTDGRFDNPGGTALDANGLRCGGAVYLNDGFHAEGQVNLTGATLAGELNCTNGVFRGPDRCALDATGLSTGDDILLNQGTSTVYAGFQAVGGVRLREARAAANVDLGGARLSTYAGGVALDACGLSAGGSLALTLAEPPGGDVDLSFATVGRLFDTRNTWPGEGHSIRLNGFSYASLESDELDKDERLAILRRMPTYYRQPYQQLSKVYREAGRSRDARDVAVDGLIELRRRGPLRRYEKAWNWFLESTVGYGYRLWQAFVLVLVIGLLNGLLFHWAEHHGLMVPTGGGGTATSPAGAQNPAGAANPAGQNPAGSAPPRRGSGSHHCLDNYPCFTPYAYSFQMLIPVINLQQLEKWVPDARQEWGGLLLFYTWLTIAIGWALAIAVTTGIGNALRGE